MNRSNGQSSLSYYGQLNMDGLDINSTSNGLNYNNNLSQRSQSATIMDNPSNNNNNNYSFNLDMNNNNNNNMYSMNQNLIREIRDLKNSFKNQLQNQNELQKKLIDSYKLISQQDNIIRLNTSKLNEHDTKLTNILVSFNNYLKVHDKTNTILNDCQNKIANNLLSIDVFNNFKSQIISNNSLINEKLKSLFNYNDDTNILLNNLKNTDENNLNLLLNKIKQINDKEESFFTDKHNENLKYIKEHDNVIISKINQLKDFINNMEVNLGEEIKCRKYSDEKIFTDITNYLKNNYEEKFKYMEKKILETEKNLINMNKDFVHTIQDRVSKQKEGNETEFKNIKNMMEVGLKKNQMVYENDMNEMKKLLSNMRGDMNETKGVIEKIDGYVKEKVAMMEEFRVKGDNSLIDFSKKIKIIEQDTLDKYEKFKKNLNEEINKMFLKENEKREEYQKTMDSNLTVKLYNYEKNINDLTQKCKQLKEMVENKYVKGSDDGKNAIGMNNVNLEEVMNNKINLVNQNLLESNKKLQNDMNIKVKEIKEFMKKNMDQYSVHVDDDLYNKFSVLSRDFKEKLDKTTVELDGKTQQYFVECEQRLKKQYEDFVNSINK